MRAKTFRTVTNGRKSVFEPMLYAIARPHLPILINLSFQRGEKAVIESPNRFNGFCFARLSWRRAPAADPPPILHVSARPFRRETVKNGWGRGLASGGPLVETRG